MFGMDPKGMVDTRFGPILNLKEGSTIDKTNPMCPSFVLLKEEHQRLYKAFTLILVVKLMGKTTNLAFMKKKLPWMWGKRGKVKVTDVENEFFLVGFQDAVDYMEAFTGGSWVVLDTYLNVMREAGV